jgi:hypothetical protein
MSDSPTKTAKCPVGNRLRHGVVGGDPASAPRCGAKTRAGTPCRGPAVHGRKRCRRHGGTNRSHSPEAIERIRQARTIHGGRSRAMIELLRAIRTLLHVGRGLAATESM